ncbi:efflux RND transporter permease subunit [Rhodovibrionaceae bacterium A322]
MSLAQTAVKNATVTYFAVFLLIVAGIASFFGLGQLEDPEFSIKTAVVSVSYPGASAEEVELEVVDRIELALQELPQVKYLESTSKAGSASITVEVKATYTKEFLPQVWDEVRRKIRDIEGSLPPGVERPVVRDDFGDVFGLVMAVTGEGYSYKELKEYVDFLRKELSLVDGVARIDLWGDQPEVIYLEASQVQLSQLGLSDQSLISTLRDQNAVVDAGSVDVQSVRMRISPSGTFDAVEDIANLEITSSTTDNLQAGGQGQDELLRIRDVGTVRRGYSDPPPTLMRYDGRPSIGLSIANLPGVNVVTMGQNVDQRLEELIADLPIGIEVTKVHWMSDVVDISVKSFLVSLVQAVVIVLVVLALSMGWRMGVIIGTALILTILGTLLLMKLLGIDLQRMSLGALIIALGMMVDNAIVVADGFVVRLEKGMERTKAAVESAAGPSLPLLGATVIAVMAFYPIYASDESAGEYCATLFSVVGIALVLSWLISVTVTPLQCIAMLPNPKGEVGTDPYQGRFYRIFRGFLEKSIAVRWLTIGLMTGLLAVSLGAFGQVSQLFFPDSSMNKFMIDYWAPEGTRIQTVAEDLERIEARLMEDERVTGVTAFIGAGPPRFYLPVDPEPANSSYAQLVVNIQDFREVDAIVSDMKGWVDENITAAQVPIRKFGVGPSNTWKLEVRISGPAIADPEVLKELASKATDILADHPLVSNYQTDWRQPTVKIVPEFSDERARWAGITREDVGNATKRAFDGLSIGLFREEDRLIPVVLRHTAQERENLSNFGQTPVNAANSTESIPILQVTDGIVTTWEDPIIGRRDRRRTVTVQANPIAGVTLPTLRAAVLADFDAIDIPPGYELVWGGEYEDTVDAQASLVPGVIPALIIVLLIIVALFNAMRPPIVILMTVPFVVIGMTWGLLLTGVPFGFVALLGAMSLSGMMIKNAIVLIDEINANLERGLTRYESTIQAALSRLRPVVLAAATTVLGVIPLLPDLFWVGLAITLMAGLSFGTLLTMLLVPVFYCTLYRLSRNRPNGTETPPLGSDPAGPDQGNKAKATPSQNPKVVEADVVPSPG